VPIAGSVVEVDGLRFEAQAPAGRRNRIGAVLIQRADPDGYDSDDAVDRPVDRDDVAQPATLGSTAADDDAVRT
jgi:hypothetical protein